MFWRAKRKSSKNDTARNPYRRQGRFPPKTANEYKTPSKTPQRMRLSTIWPWWTIYFLKSLTPPSRGAISKAKAVKNRKRQPQPSPLARPLKHLELSKTSSSPIAAKADRKRAIKTFNLPTPRKFPKRGK